MYETRGEVVMIHTMAQQINILSENAVSFETFKSELTGVLKPK